MAVSCVPADLAEAAKCYCFDAVTREKIKIYLLAVLAGKENKPPQELAEVACGYCFDAKTNRAIQSYLLCLIAQAH